MKHIIKKILKENFENFEWVNEIPESFNQWLHNNHPEWVNTVGEFLKDYENLKPSVVDGNKRFYSDDNGNKIFYYNQMYKSGFCFFRDFNFWEVFEYKYHMLKPEIQEVLKMWLEFTYNLEDMNPVKSQIDFRMI